MERSFLDMHLGGSLSLGFVRRCEIKYFISVVSSYNSLNGGPKRTYYLYCYIQLAFPLSQEITLQIQVMNTPLVPGGLSWVCLSSTTN